MSQVTPLPVDPSPAAGLRGELPPEYFTQARVIQKEGTVEVLVSEDANELTLEATEVPKDLRITQKSSHDQVYQAQRSIFQQRGFNGQPGVLKVPVVQISPSRDAGHEMDQLLSKFE